MRRGLTGLATLALWLLAAPSAWAACDRTWDDGGATQSWHEAANWDTDTVPGAGDEVCISPGFTEITYTQAGAASFERLLLQSPMKVGPGAGAITLAGPNTPSIQAPLTLDSSALILNASTGVSADITMTNGASLTNNATLDIANGVDIVTSGGGAVTLVRNTGTLRKLAPDTGISFIAPEFDNDGAVEVHSGALQPQGGGGSGFAPHSGTWSVAAGARLAFTGGSHDLTGTVSGAGRVDINAILSSTGTWDTFGIINYNTATLSGNVDIDFVGIVGGTLTINDAIAPGNVEHVGGTLTGTGAVTTPDYDWSGGTQSGPGATIVTGGPMTITGDSAKTASGRQIDINADSTLSGAGDLRLDFGSTLTVAAAFAIAGDTDVHTGSGTGTVRVTPAGTLRHTGAGRSVLAATDLELDGPADVQAGILEIRAGDRGTETSAGAWSIAAGAQLAFFGQNGAFTLSGGVSGDFVSIVGGSSVVANAPISVARLDVSGGELTGTGAVTAPSLNWSGGILSGLGTTTISAGGTVAISGAATKTLASSRTLVLNSPGTVTGAGQLHVSSSSQLVLNALLDFLSDADITFFGSQGSLTVNAGGTIGKSGGDGPTQLDVPFEMDGTVNVLSGAIGVTSGPIAGTSSTGSWTGNGQITASSMFTFAGPVTVGSFFSNGSNTTTGTFTPGNVAVSGGSLTLNGPSEPGSLGQTGGTFTVNDPISPNSGFLTGTGTLTGSAAITPTSFSWEGGTMAGTGPFTVPVGGTLTMSQNTNKILDGRPLNIAGTANLTGGTLTTAGNTQIANSGLFQVDGDFNINNGGNGGGAFRNTGTLRKTANTVPGGSTTISTPIDNDGTVNVQPSVAGVGNLAITGGGIAATESAGTFTAGGSARLIIGSGSSPALTISSAGSISAPSGSVIFDGGTTTVNGTLTASELRGVNGTHTLNGATAVTSNLLVEGGTFTLNDDISPADATQTGGTLTGTGAITTPSFRWFGGTLAGTGAVTVPTGGTLTMSQNTNKILDGRPLNIAGTANLTGGTLTAAGNAQIANSGLFQVDGDFNINNGGNGGGAFRNTGTLRKTANTVPGGSTTISTPIDNDGTVNVQPSGLGVGNLLITGGGIAGTESAGTFTATGSARLIFGSGSSPALTIGNGGSIDASSGSVIFDGGTTTVNGTLTAGELRGVNGTHTLNGATAVTSNLLVEGGTLTLNDDISPADATQTGGTLTGTGAITTPSFRWFGGTVAGGGGLTIPSGTFSASGVADKTLSRLLTVASGATATLTAHVSAQSPGRIENAGLLIVGAGGLISGVGGVHNTGIVRHDTPAVNATVVGLDNDGTVEILRGGITAVNAPLTPIESAGAWNVSAGATLLFNANMQRITTAGSISCAGAALVQTSGDVDVDGTLAGCRVVVTTSGRTLTLDGPADVASLGVVGGTVTVNDPIAPATVTHAGGTLTGSASVTTASYDWTGGTMAGTGTTMIPAGGLLDVHGSADKTVDGRPVTVDGGAIVRDLGDLVLGTGAVLTNNGAFDLDGDGVLVSGAGRLVNSATGTISKDTGAGAAQIAARVTNAGTVAVDDPGTLLLSGTFDNWDAGTKTLTGGTYDLAGTLQFAGADVTTNAAQVILKNTGRIADTAGTPADGLRNLAQNAAAGVLSLRSGRQLTVSDALANAGEVDLRDGALLRTAPNQPYTQSAGGETVLRAADAILHADASTADLSGGTLSGIGTVRGTLRNIGARIEPGLSAGRMTVEGAFEQQPGGTLRAEVAGTAPGTQHDQLDVSGAATLGGTLAVVHDPAFDPANGASVRVLEHGSRSGAFAAVTGAVISAAKRYLPTYGATATDLVVTAPPTLSVGDITVTEGSGGAPTATFTVTLSAPHTEVVSVGAATAPDTATTPADYATTSGPVAFMAGETTRPVTVNLVGDALDEPDERFFLDLANAVAATIADNRGAATIIDDDDAPSVSVGDIALPEGDSGTKDAVFTVSLSAPSGRTTSVALATADGTATAPADYTAAATTTLTFDPGQTMRTVAVPVVGDTNDEPDETFTVGLRTPSFLTLGDASGQGLIQDDDPTPVVTPPPPPPPPAGVGTTPPGSPGTAPAAAAAPPAPLRAEDVATLPSARRCVKRAGLGVVVKRPAGTQLKRVEILVNGKRVKKATFNAIGNRVPFTLPKTVKGGFTLGLVVVTTDDRKVTASRKLKACAVKR